MSYLVFISFQSSDSKLAGLIRNALQGQGISVFLAPDSISPGARWSDEIFKSLKSSDMVLFLASKKAIHSDYVAQEIGGAHFSNKLLVPVIWEIKPEELPGWAKGYQALDLRKLGPVWLNHLSQWIASLKDQKNKNSFYNKVALGVLAGLLVWAGSENDDNNEDV